MVNRSFFLSVIAGLVSFGLPMAAHGVVWSGGTSNLWSLAGNWSGGLPTNAAVAEFNTAGAGNLGVSLTGAAAANRTIDGLAFNNNATSAVTISGLTGTNQLTLDGTAVNDLFIDSGSGATHIISGAKSGSAADIVFNANANYQVLLLSGGLKIDANVGTGTETRFIKNGVGLLEFSANNASTWIQSTGTSTGRYSVNVQEGPVLFSALNAKGAATNSVKVGYDSNTTIANARGTLRLSANYGDLTRVPPSTTNPHQGILRLEGTGWEGSIAGGEGALNNIAGNNTITATAVNPGQVEFSEEPVGTGTATGSDGVPVRIRVSAGSLTINAPIVDGIVVGPAAPEFQKTGPGLLVFDTFTHTYTGNSTVMAGTLLVNSTYSGGGDFNVLNLATLGGTGDLSALASSVAVSGGGTLAPGASIGNFAVGGDVDLLTDGNGNSILSIEYDGTTGPGNDLIDLLTVDGDFDISGGTVSFLGLDNLDDEALVFATYGTLNGNLPGAEFASVLGLPTSYTIDYAYNGNSIALVPVPEPGSFLITVFGLSGLWRVGAKRRKA